jgi:mono/diheme cytochrome c family protein
MYFKTSSDHFTARDHGNSIERGKNLALNVCGGCHYDKDKQKFIGKQMHDLPKIAGRLYSANLTQSTTYGKPVHYTDSELFYLLKTGISRSGRFMPYMMRPMMADEDINDIIVYLRSNDPAVAPADTITGTTHINFIGKIGIRYLTSPQPYNKNVPRPEENNPVVYGRYLVAVIGCYHCHSPRAKKLDYFNAENTKGFMTGGMRLKDRDGNRIYSANLTPDKETGIGNYSLEEFIKAVTEGIALGERKIRPPMPKFVHLTSVQLNSIYTYLKSLPPVHHQISR